MGTRIGREIASKEHGLNMKFQFAEISDMADFLQIYAYDKNMMWLE